MKKVFTTGQVAKICKVAPRTVSKWFDSGRLRGYRIPGSQDRRIPREHLIKFLKEHGMPLGELDGESRKILVIGAADSFRDDLGGHLEGGKYEFETATSAFQAGINAEAFQPGCLVIDLAMGDDALKIVASLKQQPEYDKRWIVALASEAEVNGTSLNEVGFDEVFMKPLDFAAMAESIDFWFENLD